MDVSKNRGTPKWMVYNGKPRRAVEGASRPLTGLTGLTGRLAGRRLAGLADRNNRAEGAVCPTDRADRLNRADRTNRAGRAV